MNEIYKVNLVVSLQLQAITLMISKGNTGPFRALTLARRRFNNPLTLLRSEGPKLCRVLAFLSAIGLTRKFAQEISQTILKV